MELANLINNLLVLERDKAKTWTQSIIREYGRLRYILVS